MFSKPSLLRCCSIACLVFFIISCAGLKPGQLNAVEKYTTVAKGLSDVPADVYSRIYQLRSQTQTLQLSAVIATNQSAKESIAALQLDLEDKLKFLDLVDSFGNAYKVLGRYAELVHAVVSPAYRKDFVKNKNEWESSFNVLVKTYNTSAGQIQQATPLNASLGGITAEIIKQIGSGKIKKLQKKYLKDAVTNARFSFESICDNFLNIDIPKIKLDLSELPAFIDENFKDFLNNMEAFETKQGNNPYNYYKLYLPVYLNWQTELRALNTEVNLLATCFKSLRNAYGALDNYLNAGHFTGEMPAVLLDMENDYYLLRTTVSKFSEVRERVFKITY